MKIALIGFGNMGKAIEEIAILRGHTISLKITSSNVHELTKNNLQAADVAIEFTRPGTAFTNVKICLDAGIPVICGTTGWLDQLVVIEKYCNQQDGTFLYASNFSVGVNIFFELNKKLASLMEGHNDYNVSIEEIHHTQKKDAPSGTAITLAEQVIERSKIKKSWTVDNNNPTSEVLVINSKRIDPATGTHHVRYRSLIDDIEITHTAHNRRGFANGAILAAEFISNKKGMYTMKDVLGII